MCTLGPWPLKFGVISQNHFVSSWLVKVVVSQYQQFIVLLPIMELYTVCEMPNTPRFQSIRKQLNHHLQKKRTHIHHLHRLRQQTCFNKCHHHPVASCCQTGTKYPMTSLQGWVNPPDSLPCCQTDLSVTSHIQPSPGRPFLSNPLLKGISLEEPSTTLWPGSGSTWERTSASWSPECQPLSQSWRPNKNHITGPGRSIHGHITDLGWSENMVPQLPISGWNHVSLK